MFKNYLTIAFRNLVKNGFYSSINILGLSAGIACSVLIMLWVNDELSWDKFHVNKARIYRVLINNQGDAEIITQRPVPLPLWEALEKTPGVKHAAPTNWGEDFLITYKDQRLYKFGYYVGRDFLNMFTFPLVQGSPSRQLQDPNSIVLTRSAAKALFGDEDPLNKVVRVNDRTDVTVTGIIQDVPDQSSFHFDCLMPFSLYMQVEPWIKASLDQWDNYSFNIYVELDEGTDLAAFEQKTKNLVKENLEETTSEVTYHPLEKFRLYGEFKNGVNTGGNIVYVRMFVVIAVFILLIACINFMNLATARSEKRAREVGIRKSIGSRRLDLIKQFMGETLVLAVFAFFLAIVWVEIFLPLFNGMVGKHLAIDYSNPLFWLAGTSVILVTGVIAGSYPALYLSRFQPALVLKGRLAGGKKGALPRKVMVTSQFFFSILLIICTLVIYRQINYLKDRPTGYDSRNLVAIPNTGEIMKNFEAIKQELLSRDLVTSITTSSSPVTAIYSFVDATWQGKREDQRRGIAQVGAGYDYTRTMGIKIKEGRDFSPDYADSSSLLISASAQDYMNLKDPIQQTVDINGRKWTIVGVFEDVIMNTPEEDVVGPTFIIYNPYWVSDLTLRLAPQKGTAELLEGIQRIFEKYNPAYPFTYRFTDDDYQNKFAQVELIGRLSSWFAGLAIFISCLGLLGLASFTAEQRTKEIGIRKVLGATVSGIVLLMGRDFARLIVLAFLLSAPLAYWLMKMWLENYSYRIAIAWWMIAAAGGISLSIAMLVISVQSFKAATSNPVRALRSE